MIGQVFVEYFHVYTPCMQLDVHAVCLYININRQSIYVMEWNVEHGLWIVEVVLPLLDVGLSIRVTLLLHRPHKEVT